MYVEAGDPIFLAIRVLKLVEVDIFTFYSIIELSVLYPRSSLVIRVRGSTTIFLSLIHAERSLKEKAVLRISSAACRSRV